MSEVKWEVKKLGEVCDFQNGFAFKSKKYKESGLPIIRITNIQNEEIDIKNLVYFDKADYNVNLDRFKVCQGDLLIAMSGGTTGKLGINNNSNTFYLNQRVGKFVPGNKINRIFLYYFLTTKVEESLKIAAGAAQPNLSTEQITNFEIPLPSISEQQRIVSLLDKAFESIDQAKANAEKNLENAKELFESYLESVFETKGEGWEEKRLEEITTKIGSGATPRGGQASYKTEGISLVRSMNIHDWEFREHNLAFIDDNQAKALNGVTVHVEDVLLNITGASVARCCVIPKEYLPARVNQHVSIIRPIKEIINSRFLNYMLTSRPFKDQLLETGEQGATRQAITKRQIENFVVTYPSIKIQEEIVSRLDNIRLETIQLESQYQTKLENLEELRKSILEKAFNGEL